MVNTFLVWFDGLRHAHSTRPESCSPLGLTPNSGVDKDNGIAPDLDIIFDVQVDGGWEPIEIVHTDPAWQDYANDVPMDDQGDFSFAALADTIAQHLEPHASIAETTGVVFDRDHPKRHNQTTQAGCQQETQTDSSMVTVAEAAELLGITPEGVYRTITKGKVRSENRLVTEVIERTVEKTYVSVDDLMQYREAHGKMGRPKKSL